ncbi:MAG: aspartate/glutamate racemase family protein [Armatimonadota bacterium]|nr:aspartate/glutamate racemase family protein [Armatimonadota bacterium]
MASRRAIFGQAVGILMQRDRILRLPGDVGNATTFPFPVRYELVDGVDPADLKNPDRARAAAPRFVEAARALEAAGARIIGTGCGYLSILQRELQAAVRVPVLSSSLLQVPWIAGALGPGRRVGIITADSRALTDAYFEPLGWTSRTVPVVIAGIEGETEFLRLLYADSLTEDEIRQMHRAMADVARRLVKTDLDIGALVLECTNLPPFASAMQEAAPVPIFDVVTLLTWGHSAAVRRPFVGYL